MTQPDDEFDYEKGRQAHLEAREAAGWTMEEIMARATLEDQERRAATQQHRDAVRARKRELVNPGPVPAAKVGGNQPGQRASLVEMADSGIPDPAAQAKQELAKSPYKPVLVNGRRKVRGVFDFDTWTWDEGAQFEMWEKQFKPNEATIAPLAKYELFLWTTRHLLPLIGKKTPTLWPVYCYLLLVSPGDFSLFKLSNRRLAKGSGVSLRSVPDAVDHLRELKLLTAKKGLWSPDGPKAAVLPAYTITTLEGLKKIYQDEATVAPLEDAG